MVEVADAACAFQLRDGRNATMGCFEIFAEGQGFDIREEDLFGTFGGGGRGNEAEEAKEDGKDGLGEIH